MQKEIVLSKLDNFQELIDVGRKLENTFLKMDRGVEKQDAGDYLGAAFYVLLLSMVVSLPVTLVLHSYLNIVVGYAFLLSCSIIFSVVYATLILAEKESFNKIVKKNNTLFEDASKIFSIEGVSDIIEYEKSYNSLKEKTFKELEENEDFIKSALKFLKEEEDFEKHDELIICLSKKMTNKKIKDLEKKEHLDKINKVMLEEDKVFSKMLIEEIE